jgi:hypothetical protein
MLWALNSAHLLANTITRSIKKSLHGWLAALRPIAAMPCHAVEDSLIAELLRMPRAGVSPAAWSTISHDSTLAHGWPALTCQHIIPWRVALGYTVTLRCERIVLQGRGSKAWKVGTDAGIARNTSLFVFEQQSILWLIFNTGKYGRAKLTMCYNSNWIRPAEILTRPKPLATVKKFDSTHFGEIRIEQCSLSCDRGQLIDTHHHICILYIGLPPQYGSFL